MARVVVPDVALAAGIPGVHGTTEDPGDVVLVAPAGAGLTTARAVGSVTVLLPDDPVRARWVAAVAVRWADEAPAELAVALQALVSTLAAGDASIVRAGSPGGPPAVALPLPMLARVMRRAWRPCPHCRRGGGVRGGPCGGCGMPSAAAA